MYFILASSKVCAKSHLLMALLVSASLVNFTSYVFIRLDVTMNQMHKL
jgi:hypothetical protein